MLNIAICDDNSSILSLVNNTIDIELKRINEVSSIQIFTNGQLLLDEHKSKPFDVIFLDIEMPDMSGFDVAKELRDSFSECFIIFITTHSELVYNSLDFQPFNFIRKTDVVPIEDKVIEILHKLLTHTRQNKKVILEDKTVGKISIFIRDILYIEGSGHYCKFFVRNKKSPIRQRCTIQECEDIYSMFNFIRTHKSYIVNLKYVEILDLNNLEIRLYGNISLPLGRKYKEETDKKYTLYLRTTI